MSSASLELQTKIYETLKSALSSYSTAVGLYDKHPVAEVAFPYVTFGDDLQRNNSTKLLIGRSHLLTLDVWSRYNGSQQVKEIMGLISDTLDRSELALTNYSLVDIQFDNELIMLDKDGETMHGIIRFNALTQKI